MLSKLYYYEARYYAKVAWLMILILIVSTATAVASQLIEIDFVRTMLFLPYPLVIFGMVCLPTVIYVTRFYRHLFTLQGYLSFTLPVKPMDHFICKIINAIVFSLIMISSTIVSGLIVLTVMFEEFSLLEGIWALITEANLWYVLSTTATICAQGLFSILIFYTAICLGQLAKNKILVSVGAWFALNYGTQILNSILLIPVIVVMSNNVTTNIAVYNDSDEFFDSFPLMLFLIASMYIVESIISIFVCRYIMTKKLNLE